MKIMDRLLIYHTPDGQVRVTFEDDDWDKLNVYMNILEMIMKRMKLVIYSEQNPLIPFDHIEQEQPTLSHYGILLRKMNLTEDEWFKLKDLIADIKYGELNDE